MAYEHMDAQLRQNLSKPNAHTTIETLIKELNTMKHIWFDMYSGYNSIGMHSRPANNRQNDSTGRPTVRPLRFGPAAGVPLREFHCDKMDTPQFYITRTTTTAITHIDHTLPETPLDTHLAHTKASMYSISKRRTQTDILIRISTSITTATYQESTNLIDGLYRSPPEILEMRRINQ